MRKDHAIEDSFKLLIDDIASHHADDEARRQLLLDVLPVVHQLGLPVAFRHLVKALKKIESGQL